MRVGVCWASPGKDPQPLFDASVLETLRESTGATHLRINLHHGRGVEECAQHVRHIRQFFKVLPILEFDYDRPALGPYAEFCVAIIRECGFDAVELGNEPYTLRHGYSREKGGMSSDRYAQAFRAGAQAIRDAGLSTEVLIACESTKSIAKPIGYFDQVSRSVPSELYHGVAIHPYRNPMPPSYTTFASREAEANHYRYPGKAIHVTEVGWDLRSGVDEQKQADYTYEELSIWERNGAASVYVYAFMDGGKDYRFGILDDNRNPRPVAAAIKRFQAERGW